MSTKDSGPTPEQIEALRDQVELYLREKQAAKDVCVSFCSPAMLHAKFVESIIALLQEHPRIGWVSQSIGGPAMALARQSQVEGFMNDTPGKYLLMVDADMVFTPQDVTTLLDTADSSVGGPAVYTGLYVDSIGRPVCGDWEDGKTRYRPLASPPAEPIRVGAAGAGFLLIPRVVFDHIGPSYAFNEIPWGQNNDKTMGEDVSFCRRLDKAGIPLILHPDVQLGHAKETVVYPNGDRIPT